MTVATVDFETFSCTDLKKCGVYKYADDPTTDAHCLAYAFYDEEPSIWIKGEPFPDRLRQHIEAGGEMRAWNAQFERIIWKRVMGPKHSWPTVRDDQWYCTAAEAAAMSLPRQLEKAAIVCKVPTQKDKRGYRIMLKVCKPKKIEFDGTIIYADATPEEWEALYAYCKDDVRAERGLYKATRRLTASEREMFLLDQRMNDRGIFLDMPLVHAAQRIVDTVQSEAQEQLISLTSGVVQGPTKVKAMKEWLALTEGIEANSLAKKAIAEILENEITPEARALLRLRAEAGKESVKKLKAMRLVAQADDRARGLLMYHGAGTGRWTAKHIQPHNMPRGELPAYDNAENYIEDVMAGAYARLNLFAPPLVIISAMLRSMIRAAPGSDLLAADYSGIECRGVNWLAGQDDILDLFRKGDAASKADKPLYDPYRHMAVAMGKAAHVLKVDAKGRQAGKAAELGCGFQMGWEKFITAAWDVYQVRVNEEESKLAVNTYRKTHDKVVQLWDDANQAAIGAVSAPGSVHRIGPDGCTKFVKLGNYLYIVLPSGRPLAYASPSIVQREAPWSTPEKRVFLPAVQFYGVTPLSKKWGPMYLYGGLIVENIVQALSRDIMAAGKLALDKLGYSPILSVHDEVVSEVAKSFGTLEEFERVLRTPPTWAKGFPIMTEGWRGERYRK